MLRHFAARARAIAVRASDVDVLYSPAEFYDTMQSLTASARNRMLWSSLYLGTGEMEKKLVDTAVRTMQTHPSLQTTMVMDGARCARTLGADSTCSQLARMQQASKHCRVWLFESPRLRGGLGDWQSHFNRALVQSGQPALARWREATGVWHMKLYIFDDTLVISGANLSDTYFTNRQDRYVVFRNARALCDYYSDFLHATCKTPSGFELPASKDKPFEASKWKTLMSSPNEIGKARRHLDPFLKPTHTSLDPEQTYVFPSFQMAPFGIRQDEDITAAVLGEPGDDPFPRGETWLASGYLNLPDRFENAITHAANAFAHGSARTHLLSAAPQANGWYGAKGIGGKVPSLYAAVEYHMLQRLSERHNHTVRSNIDIFEYNRPGWSYHAKGMWMESAAFSNAATSTEFLTAVGSPNYSSRSLEGDIETQLFLVTRDASLQNKFRKERAGILEHSRTASLDTFEGPRADKAHRDALDPLVRTVAHTFRHLL